MATIVVGGDCATTTAVALAAGWPEHGPDTLDDREREVVVVEADPTGGSLAAWFDCALSPSVSSVVAALHQGASTGSTPATQWRALDPMIRRSDSGIRFVPAPFRALEARGAISEAERHLLPLLAHGDRAVAIVDVGRIDPHRIPVACRDALVTLVVHRLDPSSAQAATARLERLAETISALVDTGHPVALAVVGDVPFGLAEVTEFAAPGASGCASWSLAIDPLAAAVFAGHRGVSARRLARLPLSRTAARVATDLGALLDSAGEVAEPLGPFGVVR